jgi:hypothetical protein
MLVYDKDLTTFFYWDGPNLQWVQVGSGSGDNWGTQVVQTAGANISGDGTAGNPLTVTDNDNDPNNEIELPATASNGEVLTWDGTNWIPQAAPSGADNWGTAVVNINGTNISGDGTTANPLTVTEVDGDITNEIQDLSLNTTTNILTITNNGTATNIDLSPYLDNTDAQTLSLTGNTLTISNGNNVTLTDNVNDADADPTNEYNSGANLTGNNLNIIDGGGTQTVDLSGLKDHDWYEVGGTNQPDNINDNIYTQGDVGIGTATPIARLHILGGPQISPTLGTRIALFDGSTNNYDDIQITAPVAPIAGENGTMVVEPRTIPGTGTAQFTTWFRTPSTNTGNTRHNVVVDGNVGIGTTTPSMKLHVMGAQYIQGGNLNITDLGGKTLRIGHDNDIGNWIQFRPENANGLAFLRGPDAHAMVVRNDGFVGIGTTAPTSLLDVNGDLRVRTVTAGGSNEEVLVVDGTGLVKKVASTSPVGEVITFAGATAPSGYLMCDGSAVSRATYADLFAVIGTTYGTGNGTTTFNLPDLRGEFIRGLDGGRGIDTGRGLGSAQKATIIAGNDDNDNNMSTMQQVNTYRNDLGWEPADFTGIPSNRVLVGWNTRSSARTFDNTANLDRWMGSVRPRNIAMNYCIRF